MNDIFDKQLEKIDKKVIFCKKCVISNQRPRITFDDKGICSACNYALIKENKIDWAERENKLNKLLDKHRSRNGSYDCLVPSSGGKDSAFVAHKLKYEYNMNPLTITWAPFLYTDLGWRNYLAFKDSGFDNILFFPNGNIYRKLSRTAFEFIGDNFLPFIYGQKNYVFHMSIRNKIPLIFYGESGELEYGGNTKNIDKSHETIEDFDEFYFKGTNLKNLIEIGMENKILEKKDLNNNLEFFNPPDQNLIKENNSQMHWFSFYKKWIPQENYYYASENTGFVANKFRSEGTYSKYSSLDDKTDGFHYFMSLVKFGIGRATSDAAHEIREKHITREEAKILVEKYDNEFPSKYYNEFLNYIGIDEDYFEAIIDKFKNKSAHLWKKINNKWHLRHNVNKTGADD